LIDVESKDAASIDATSALIKYNTVDGSAYGSAFVGLVAGDFTIQNTTIASPVVVASAVESPEGTYTLTFAAQTASDLGVISATKAGFEFESGNITFQ
jgi:hypothetical protein